jgi:predicted enzyme related to lactoylglutathione lyase
MPVRRHYAPGTPCWIDRVTTNLTRTQTFYGSLFGWDYAEEGGYQQAQSAGRTVAGFGSAPMPLELWNVYLASKNLEASAELVGELGGTVVMPPTALGAIGRLFLAIDPAGATVGFWQGAVDEGIVLADEIGASCRYELVVPDRAAVQTFYGTVGQDIAIVEAQTRPYWRIGFGVRDVAASAFAAATTGARDVTHHADGSATVTDPGGARFGLVAV